MLLTNATILPMDNEPIPRGYVRVEDGRITALGGMPSYPGPRDGEKVFDLGGSLLLPGFIDAHCHLGLAETGMGLEGDDINEDTDPCTPHLRAIDGTNPLDAAFADALRSGVTCAVVSPGSTNPVAGQICAVKTHGRWIDKMAVAQPLAIKFSLGENPKMTYGPRPQNPITRMGSVAIIREQLAMAQRYLADQQKAQAEDLDPPDYDAKCEALLPLLTGQIAAHFHAHKSYDILTAVRISKEFLLKYAIIHGTEAHLIADILAEEQVPVICGPFLCAKTKPELAGMSPKTCPALAEAGVVFAISTDHPELPSDCLLISAAVARSQGLTQQQALHAITLGAAKAAGLDTRLGSITPGKDADLLVFCGSLDDIGARPDMVFIGGDLVYRTNRLN